MGAHAVQGALHEGGSHGLRVLIDTLETSVTWENIHKVHSEVRSYITSRPKTMCMTHARTSTPGHEPLLHFLMRAEASTSTGPSTGHRGPDSGLGRIDQPPPRHRPPVPSMAEPYLGPEQISVLKTLKRHFDPNGIMKQGCLHRPGMSRRPPASGPSTGGLGCGHGVQGRFWLDVRAADPIDSPRIRWKYRRTGSGSLGASSFDSARARSNVRVPHLPAARDLYRFDESIYTFTGNVIMPNPRAAREFATG
jgi:hypothetical protein